MSDLSKLRDPYADGVGVLLYKALDPARPTACTRIDPGAGLRFDEVLTSFSLPVAQA